jgi:hypothetical protein
MFRKVAWIAHLSYAQLGFVKWLLFSDHPKHTYHKLIGWGCVETSKVEWLLLLTLYQYMFLKIILLWRCEPQKQNMECPIALEQECMSYTVVEENIHKSSAGKLLCYKCSKEIRTCLVSCISSWHMEDCFEYIEKYGFLFTPKCNISGMIAIVKCTFVTE